MDMKNVENRKLSQVVYHLISFPNVKFEAFQWLTASSYYYVYISFFDIFYNCEWYSFFMLPTSVLESEMENLLYFVSTDCNIYIYIYIYVYV